ncbi:hypothetical protein BT69DRAFT_1285242 [Atractiella rhizophila]|nr:hypothetical protein BT69DRAFT_1285242 [Atractiella rhizophila]
MMNSSLEQSEADLDLLLQNLEKGKRVTERMVGGLKGFDTRLSKLESSILPIHKSTSRLTKVARNIEQVLRALDGLLGYHDLVETESEIIKAGPNSSTWSTSYTASLDRLLDASKQMEKSGLGGGRTKDPTYDEIHALLKEGARSLGDMILGWVKKETPSKSPDASKLLSSQPPGLLPTVLDPILKVLLYIRTLPNVSSIEKGLHVTYADLRNQYVTSCTEVVGKKTLDGVKEGDVPRLGRYADFLLEQAEVEYKLVDRLWGPAAAPSVFAKVMSNSLAAFANACTSVNSVVKKSLGSTVSLAFDCYAELQSRQDRFDEVVRGRSGRKENELGDMIHSFRASCLRTLPEFIEDTKAFGTKAPSTSELADAGVSGVAVNVVNFMRQLCDKQDVVESLLSTLGPGNWIFGGRGVGGGSKAVSENDPLIEQYLADVLHTLLVSLEARAKTLSTRTRSGFSPIFFLNNLSYIRREITSSAVSDLLPDACQDELNKKMRTAKTAYLEIWSPLVSAMLDVGNAPTGVKAVVGGKESNERKEVKDRFGRFNEGLEDIEALHLTATLEKEGGNELRNRLKDEVNRMVVPTYAKFAQKHKDREFSKNPSKYFKYDADQLQERLGIIFG